MKWLDFYLELRLETERKLASLSPVMTPLERLREGVRIVVPAITQVYALFRSHPPSTREEEIQFFKEIKPWFDALKIYEVDRFQLMNMQPKTTREKLRAYFEEELYLVERLFRQHPFYYQYYRFGPEELDRLYFLRDSKIEQLNVPEFQLNDDDYQTALDWLFAQFIAKERLRDFILEQLQEPTAQETISNSEKGTIEAQWTGEAVNLFEIAVGVWLTGQVNHGNLTLTETVRWLEEKLSVKIGRPNKRWNEISSRTRNSPTKFLQRMQDGVRHRIDEELGVNNATRKARRSGE